jgi:hypothetical protein
MWGSEGIAPTFLTSALDRGKWSASSPCHFTPGGKCPQYVLDRRLCQCINCNCYRNKRPLILLNEPEYMPKASDSSLPISDVYKITPEKHVWQNIQNCTANGTECSGQKLIASEFVVLTLQRIRPICD